MEEQNSMKINQLPSKTWYWLGLNDTKVKWAAGAPCEICAEEPSADDEITDFPENMNTGAGKETDILFAPEQTKNWSISAKDGQTKQVTLSVGQGKETLFGLRKIGQMPERFGKFHQPFALRLNNVKPADSFLADFRIGSQCLRQ